MEKVTSHRGIAMVHDRVVMKVHGMSWNCHGPPLHDDGASEHRLKTHGHVCVALGNAMTEFNLIALV